MSRVLFIVAALIAVIGFAAATFAPVENLGDSQALFARLVVIGPALLVAVVVFGLGAIVQQLTRLITQNEELLDRLAAALSTTHVVRGPEVEVPPQMATPAAQMSPAPFEPPPAPVVMPVPEPAWPPVAPEPAPMPAPAPRIELPPLDAPAPHEPVSTPAPARPLPPLGVGPAATDTTSASEPAPKRGFKLGRLFGRGAAPAAAPAVAVAGDDRIPRPEDLPDVDGRQRPAFDFQMDDDRGLADATDVPKDAVADAVAGEQDSLADRLSAALMAANAAADRAPVVVDDDWGPLDSPIPRPEPQGDDRASRVGADALTEALLGGSLADEPPSLPVETPRAQRPQFTPSVGPARVEPDVAQAPVAAPEPRRPEPQLPELTRPEPVAATPAPAFAPIEAAGPDPEPAPEPMPAPAPEPAPMVVVSPPAPTAEASPPAEPASPPPVVAAPPEPEPVPKPEPDMRAPTVAEFIARGSEPEPAPAPRVVREGQFAGRRYRMFEDGSLEIDTEQSTIQFSSLEEFRTFVASAGRRPTE